MLSLNRILGVFGVTLISLVTTNAYGQATRTWVSGVGDDANPCSRTAPCKTFAGAISKTAAGGAIDVLDPGGFGGVTITKAISIEADGVIAGVLVSGTNGIVISAGATDVIVLRGLTIDGDAGTGTSGIKVIGAGTVVVDHCYIARFATRGISVEPNGGSLIPPTKVFISNTEVQGNASNGIVVAPVSGSRAQVSLDHVNIVDNTNFGLSITGGATVVVENSTISDNAVGTLNSNVRVDGTAGIATLDLNKVAIAGAPTGIIALTNAIVRVGDSTIVNNTNAISTSGGVVDSYGNNRITNGAFSATITLH